MGYLQLDEGVEDSTKGIISLWFRVPDTAAAKINLMTFGKNDLVFDDYEPGFLTICNCGFSGPLELVASSTLDPCSIYLDKVGSAYRLRFRFQMSNAADGVNIAWHDVGGACSNYAIDGSEATTPDLIRTPGTGYIGTSDCPGAAGAADYGSGFGIVDDTADTNPAAENFFVSSIVDLRPGSWHHLLLAYDFSQHCSTRTPPNSGDGNLTRNANTAAGTTSFCHLFYAVDAVNRNGEDHLGPNFVDGQTDLNAILTSSTHQLANGQNPGLSAGNVFTPQSFLDWSPTAVPTSGYPLGLPADASHLADIAIVEMADLQMWTGQSLDTSVLENRRLFVTDTGRPASMANAAVALGRPAVALKGSTNWINGISTGSAGDLTPTGTIVQYDPGPSL